MRFIEECFCPGQHVVVMDDNVVWLRRAAVADGAAFLEALDLPKQVRQARQEMQRHGAHLRHGVISFRRSPGCSKWHFRWLEVMSQLFLS